MTDTHPVTHHSAHVNGIRLRYARAGEGPPIVLLHGFPQSGREWRHVIPHLAKDHTVIAPDLRGFGDSDRPATGYDKRTVAQDVHELVRHLGFDEIDLVGHDVGMLVAYDYAAQHRGEVRRLVVMDSVSRPASAAFFWSVSSEDLSLANSSMRSIRASAASGSVCASIIARPR